MDKKDFFEDVDEENKKIAGLIKDEADNKALPERMSSEELHELLKTKEGKKAAGVILKLGALVAGIALFIGIFGFTYNKITNDSGQFNVVINKKNNDEVENKLSYSDIYNKLKKLQISNNAIDYGKKELLYAREMKSLSKVNNTAMAQSDTYNTNVQTQGIDEADIVKTNGKNIFLLNRDKGKVFICDANGENTKQISKINLSSEKKENNYEYNEMYVSGNRLVIFASEYNKNPKAKVCYDIAIYSGNTKILIYDITDIENSKLLSTLAIEGNYNSSRLDGNILYTVTEKNIDDISKDNCVPYVQGEKMKINDIYIPENSDGNGYIIVTSVNILKPDKIMETKAIAAGNANIYMSKDNLYLYISKNSEVDISNTSEGKKYLKKLNKEEKNIKVKKAYKKYLKKAYPDINLNKVYAKEKVLYVKEQSDTEIIKIQCKDGSMKLTGDGKVEGTLDNNLSMDEYKGYIRMVTTVSEYKSVVNRVIVYNENDEVVGYEDIYDEENADDYVYNENVYNNLYILDAGMRIVAKIEGLAENEEIYSARFMGNYGYFVTYRNTDPLFAVDFSDIENPNIIGKLKISGYSDYLHFYGDDRLLGLGMNTENENNQKIKLDMYNVKNGNAILESRKVIDKADYSDGLYNYKAIMVSYDKNIIGFMADNYGPENITNYYIYGYNEVSKKFERKAMVKMSEESYSSRGMYIGEYVYIVEDNGNVTVLNMNNYDKVLSFKMK